MNDTALVFTEASSGVQRIEMRRPEKRNALTHAMYIALAEGFKRAIADDTVRVILITGAPNAFCSGNDIVDFLAHPPSDENAPVFQFLRALIGCEKPVVAGVAGMAVGIGTTMLLHCDYVVAAENAELSVPFVNIGLCPEAASSVMLPLAIGHKRAAEMLMFGDRVPAATALDWGIVNALVPNDALAAAAGKKALTLAAKPPAALRATKMLLKRSLVPGALEAMEREAREFGSLLHSPAARECLSAFIEKRAPDPAKY
jgi:enoyl-CoA hydratase/carnithine racemase